jgi:hypothetical protein
MKFATFCAICSAFSSLVFGCFSMYFAVTRHDIMFVPFAIIGLFGALVMWANRK